LSSLLEKIWASMEKTPESHGLSETENKSDLDTSAAQATNV
jgi:hypothetical protein